MAAVGDVPGHVVACHHPLPVPVAVSAEAVTRA
jgi:hypothetical protein